MAFRIIYDHIMTAAQYINKAYHSLVTIIQKDGIFFHFKFSQFCFQLFMVITVSTHHTGTHGAGKAKFGCGFCILFSYFRMIGQTEIIIQTPYDHFLATEYHTAADYLLPVLEKQNNHELFHDADQ